MSAFPLRLDLSRIVPRTAFAMLVLKEIRLARAVLLLFALIVLGIPSGFLLLLPIVSADLSDALKLLCNLSQLVLAFGPYVLASELVSRDHFHKGDRLSAMLPIPGRTRWRAKIAVVAGTMVALALTSLVTAPFIAGSGASSFPEFFVRALLLGILGAIWGFGVGALSKQPSVLAIPMFVPAVVLFVIVLTGVSSITPLHLLYELLPSNAQAMKPYAVESATWSCFRLLALVGLFVIGSRLAIRANTWVSLGRDPDRQGPKTAYKLLLGGAAWGFGSGIVATACGLMMPVGSPAETSSPMRVLRADWSRGYAYALTLSDQELAVASLADYANISDCGSCQWMLASGWLQVAWQHEYAVLEGGALSQERPENRVEGSITPWFRLARHDHTAGQVDALRERLRRDPSGLRSVYGQLARDVEGLTMHQRLEAARRSDPALELSLAVRMIVDRVTPCSTLLAMQYLGTPDHLLPGECDRTMAGERGVRWRAYEKLLAVRRALAGEAPEGSLGIWWTERSDLRAASWVNRDVLASYLTLEELDRCIAILRAPMEPEIEAIRAAWQRPHAFEANRWDGEAKAYVNHLLGSPLED